MRGSRPGRLPAFICGSIFDSCLFVSIRGSVLDLRLQFAGEVVGGDVHLVSQIEAMGFEALDTGIQD